MVSAIRDYIFLTLCLLAVLVGMPSSVLTKSEPHGIAPATHPTSLFISHADTVIEPGCQTVRLADIVYWAGADIRTYTVRFQAMRGGDVTILVGGSAAVAHIPQDELSRSYSLSATWQGNRDYPTEVRVDANSDYGDCAQVSLRIWDIGIEVSP